jgi:hypothetical protein
MSEVCAIDTGHSIFLGAVPMQSAGQVIANRALVCELQLRRGLLQRGLKLKSPDSKFEILT